MSFLHTEIKYLNLISPQLRNYKKCSNHLWNFSCPICGDSQKNKLKARGYIYEKKNELFYRCHNCSIGLNLGNFIKEVEPTLYNQYVMERYKNKPIRTKKDLASKTTKETRGTFEIGSTIPQIKDIEEQHPARSYLFVDRNLPKKVAEGFYYASNFADFVKALIPHNKYQKLGKEPRIVIPYYNEDSQLVGFSGRSFTEKKGTIKYVTIKLDENENLVYGRERWSKNKTTYVVEGPLDSLFLPNSLAVGNANLISIINYVPRLKKPIFVFDNDRRNSNVVKNMAKVIDSGHKICIWPEQTIQDSQDINDMILSGMTPESVLNTINTNTFQGLEAKLKFGSWKKC